MALKRTADTLVAMQEMKRTRNELVPITNNDRALLEVVSNSCFHLNELNSN